MWRRISFLFQMYLNRVQTYDILLFSSGWRGGGGGGGLDHQKEVIQSDMVASFTSHMHTLIMFRLGMFNTYTCLSHVSTIELIKVEIA